MSGGTGAERLTTERSSRTWSSLASRTESRHLLLGGAGAVLGALVGLLALLGTAPLAGAGSIGQVAALAVLGCGTATAALTLSTLTRRSMPWLGGRRWWRRALDILGLALIHGVLGLFLTGALFGVFQQAFQGSRWTVWRAPSGSRPHAAPPAMSSPPRPPPSPDGRWRPCSRCS